MVQNSGLISCLLDHLDLLVFKHNENFLVLLQDILLFIIIVIIARQTEIGLSLNVL